MILKPLRRLWRQFPAVLILGPRQAGKTTLAKQFLPKGHYCDLEDPHTRSVFETEPRFQMEQRADRPLILDEAQLVPVVFEALRGMIDQERRRTGRFCLLGSAQPALVRQASETLAGRVGILELDPLICAETAQGSKPIRPQQLWLKGGFPDALSGDFRLWWESYLRTYIERDLPHFGIQADPLLMRRLMTMLAHQQGGVLNLSQLGSALGVSYHTADRYMGWMEQTFLVRRLSPYFRNVGKRLTKSPKVYLRDPGLVHHLLNISTMKDLEHHPIRGASWEGFVIEELIRRERVVRPYTQCYFWRTAAGAEVDFIFDRGDERVAVEIKAGGTEDVRAARHLQSALDDIGATRGYILDQAKGVTPMVPRVERRGFFESLTWLP
ncbi:MAG: ATP-binding protein [Nitrospirota bacterium]